MNYFQEIEIAIALLKVDDDSAVKTALNNAKTAVIASNFATASTELQTALNEVSNLGSSYTTAEKEAITTAIKAAKTVVDELPSQEIEIAIALLKVDDDSAVKTALNNAKTAVIASNFATASTELQTAIDEVSNLDDSSYTTAEKEAITAAITAAKEEIDNGKALLGLWKTSQPFYNRKDLQNNQGSIVGSPSYLNASIEGKGNFHVIEHVLLRPKNFYSNHFLEPYLTNQKDPYSNQITVVCPRWIDPLMKDIDVILSI